MCCGRSDVTGPAVVSIVLAVVWFAAGAVVLRTSRATTRGRALALCCGSLTGAHVAAALDARTAPLALAAWTWFGLAIADGRLATGPRRGVLAVVTAGSIAWTVTALAGGADVGRAQFVLAGLGAAAIGAVGSLARYPKGSTEQQRVLRWLGAGSVSAATFLGVVTALDLMADAPRPLDAWLLAGLVLVPLAQILARTVASVRAAAAVVVEAVATAGVAAVFVAVYLVIIVGLGGKPHGRERDVLLASMGAAVLVAALAVPVRRRLITFAGALIGDTEPSTDQVVTGFGARMSRAVPMDELMLQLVESLHSAIASAGAEIWTGTNGLLSRAVSFPARGAGRFELSEQDRVVVGRARIGGPSWAAVWLPDIEPGPGPLRAVPVAHLGELLGLIVVRRGPDEPDYSEDDERALVEVARQLGLALHNVRLDSALQASLAELAARNQELQASRLRIVTAADSSRRAIERNLHDGAQQHLVALAVRLGLARQIAEDGDIDTVLTQLDELRVQVQTTVGELRELAHGIYPPLLRDRGLGEALRTAALRSPLPCTVDVDLDGRYPEQVETAAYFCCLEGMQNAGKYAGDGATLAVHVRGDAGTLCFDLVDDGAGFDPTATAFGHGFLNMQDRLGAIGGRLEVESAPGKGTTVRAIIPTADPS
jgi:signal transduction histidine kinase